MTKDYFVCVHCGAEFLHQPIHCSGCGATGTVQQPTSKAAATAPPNPVVREYVAGEALQRGDVVTIRGEEVFLCERGAIRSPEPCTNCRRMDRLQSVAVGASRLCVYCHRAFQAGAEHEATALDLERRLSACIVLLQEADTLFEVMELADGEVGNAEDEDLADLAKRVRALVKAEGDRALAQVAAHARTTSEEVSSDG